MEAQQSIAVEAGDVIRVQIANDAPIGGATQQATFTAESADENEIVGTDENWGDTCTVEGLQTDSPRYTDGGKSGDVVSVEVMDTTDDGVPIHNSGWPVYEA